LIYQVSRGDLDMLEVSEAEAATLAEQAGTVDAGAVTRVMEVLSECEMRLRDAASKKILIEVAMLKAIEARHALSLDSVLQQLQALRGGEAVPPAPTASPAIPPSPTPKARTSATMAATAETTPVTAIRETPVAPVNANGGGDLTRLWNRLVESVGRASPFTRTYLLEAHPVSFKNNVFTIGFDPEFDDHLSLVDNARNHTLLQTKLGELGHAGAQIKFVKAERPADWVAAQPAEPEAASVAAAVSPTSAAVPSGASKPAPSAATPVKQTNFNKDDFKNDPLIKRALEIFKGQIVEVRN
jgi:DNA polymerase-3 subunit gamma/tau